MIYSQFCFYIQQDEQKRRATEHIPCKPREQIEVDWFGNPAYVTDSDTSEENESKIFIGVLTYNQYADVEAFLGEKTISQIKAHVHMFEYFDGAAKILVLDNTKIAVNHRGNWFTQER